MIDLEARAYRLVAEAISQQFRVDVETIRPETIALDIAGWDSFSNGLLIMAIEEATGRMMPFDQLACAENVGDMARVVAEQL